MTKENHESISSDSSLCAEHVRQYDPDRYLCAMFSPPPTRQALMSLFAFNSELAMIRDRVNERLLGEIRFQWWREQIDRSFAGSGRPEGIAGALHDFINRFKPSKDQFEILIENRIRDLSDDLFEDTPAFERYCSGSTTPLIRMSLLPITSGAPDDPALDTVTHHAGIAWAATGLIRAIPSLAAHGRCMIPLSLLEHNGVTRETIYAQQARPSLKRIVEETVSQAEHHLNSARTYIRAIDPTLFPAFLPLAMADFYLSTIRKSGFDPFHARVQQPNNAVRALRLMYAAWRKQC